MFGHPTAPPRSRRAAARLDLHGSLPPAALVGTILLASAAGPAQAQLLRGLLDTGSGSGVLGTGLTVGTTAPGGGVLGTGLTVGTTGSLLGTGVTVGSTNPGDGVLGTGVTVGTSAPGGALSTGVVVGTTGPGDGLLGTGLTLGTTTATGPGGGPTGQPLGPTGQPLGPTGQPLGPTRPTTGPGEVITIDSGGPGANFGDIALRLSRLEQQMGAPLDVPLRGTDTSQAGTPRATGQDAVAGGHGAAASGNGATALGSGANAAGDGSVALGRNASATQAGSVAIGTGARTSRAGQVALGSEQSTYTMAGIASSASRAAQSGATQFITTDAAGNLAASGYGPGNIAALEGRVDALGGRVGALESSVGRLQREMRGAYQGTAIALALTGAVLPAGKTFAVSTSFGTYRGETGFGASGVARVSDNLFVSGGVGFSTSGQANVAGRGGLTLAW